MEERTMNGSLVKNLGISGPILDSLRDQICLLDKKGTIIFVNEEWIKFASSNGGAPSATGPGVNYLEVCEKDSPIYNGLKAMLTGRLDYFDHEYPCHSPAQKRWFIMQATQLRENNDGMEGVVIRHADITKQKILEIQLKEYANKDALTNLYNRRYFEKRLKKESERLQKKDTTLSLLYIDVDDFKGLNDNYGHLTGDKVLKKISHILPKCVRETDTIARIGGDEFAAFLPNIDPSELKTIAERIISNVQQSCFDVNSFPVNVTISIGGAEFSDGISLPAMIKRADEALYHAKDRGKNQVVFV